MALVEVAAAEHVNHAYLICGVCIAKRALEEDAKQLQKRPRTKR